MKKHDKVKTPNGTGEFSGDIDQPKSDNPRYGVVLDNSPFSYPVAYYRKDEIKKMK